MADWDEEEAKYLANPEKYIENLGKELDLQRESQTRSMSDRNNYSEYDDREQHQTALEFFRNFQDQLTTNLKRGTIQNIPMQTIFQLAKSCIKSKDKKREFAQLVFSEEPENIDEVEKYFVKVMTN